uniref:Uncharacterized protein n=1 Tax=Ditylenchus dipsaci TaxID=166011 RepID=A0A915DMT9_9BILA
MKDDKYRCLEQRLTKSDRKKTQTLPRKSLHEVKRSASLPRIKKIAELILGSKRQTLSYEEFHQTSESVRHELHILSPEKKSSESAKLAPLEDIRLCISMSGRQRSQLKSELIKVKKDIFAPTHQVRQHLEQISAELELESSISNGKQFTWVSNVKIILERRLSRLHQSGSLDFSGRFGGNVFLFFVADKGGTTTKCAIGIGNVKRANSADNLLLISLFDDSDDHQNLDKLKDVLFNQLLFESVRVGGEEKAVKWFATGDLKILSALYGHMGSSSTFSCLLCEAPKNSFKDNNIYPARTLFSIDQGFCRYLYFSDAALSRKRTEQLGKNSKSISKQPILNVPIAHIVPPSLHIVQGLAQNTVNLMEEMNPELVPQLEIVYRSLGADKQNFYQTFTGNHIRKLLTGEVHQNRTYVASWIDAECFLQAAIATREIQSYARASFLVEDEIDHFETKTNQFFECMRVDFLSEIADGYRQRDKEEHEEVCLRID